MKTHYTWIILAGVTASLGIPRSSTPWVPQETEPPLSLRVSGLGEERSVFSGESFEVTVGGETRTVTIEALPTRVLCIPEACFEYPAHFSFEFDPSEGSRTWTLDGNDATIIVQESPVAITTRSFAESMAEAIEEIGDEGAEWIKGDSIEAEGFRIETLHFVVPLEDMEFRLDVHGLLQGERGKTAKTFLVVQEVADLDAEVSPEVERVRELLAASLTRVE